MLRMARSPRDKSGYKYPVEPPSPEFKSPPGTAHFHLMAVKRRNEKTCIWCGHKEIKEDSSDRSKAHAG